MDVKFDKYSLIINGERTVIRSGAMHYFRTIGEGEWRDRLSKMKAGGFNAVDLYLCWNFHNIAEDVWGFDGYKNIRRLFEIARELGIFIIARPGPYVNAEVSAGGLPYWLLKKENVIPRNRKDGDYVYSPEYMKYLRSWYSKVMPVIKDFEDIVVAFQIENEYSTNNCETEYMEELYALARESGVTAPIFHNDAFIAGLYADIVDIYACDIYPYINPRDNWRENTFSFDTLDNLEDMTRCYSENSPMFIAEMQAGWYDKWLGTGYDTIREDMCWQHLNIMTKTALSQGVTMFNHYMTVGGTNILDTSSDEVYSSYDFAAPISEFGAIQENFHKAKEINYLLEGFNFAQTEPKETDFEVPENCYARIRKDLINDCDWLFLRNFNTCEFQISRVNIQSFDMKMLPRNLKLRGCEVLHCGLEFFTKVQNEDTEYVFVITDSKNHMEVSYNGKVEHIWGEREDYETLEFDQTRFVFVSRKLLNHTWKLDQKLIFGANFVYPDGRIATRYPRSVRTFSPNEGWSEKYLEPAIKPLKLNLTDFKVDFCAPEIELGYDYSSWKTLEESDVCSEFIWYKGKISNNVREISIMARHIFGIYINGKELLNRNSYKHDNLMQIDEHIDITVSEDYFIEGHDAEVTVLVQNLGFDRGFSNNINQPRGLIYFKTDTGETPQWRVRGRIMFDERPDSEGRAPYLAALTKEFEIPEEYLGEKVYAPIMLDMGNTPFRRATIFLNGIKVGRFIRSNSHQSKFYLPPQFVKNKNEIKIIVWEKGHRIESMWHGAGGFKNYLMNVIIKIENFKVYEIFSE